MDNNTTQPRPKQPAEKEAIVAFRCSRELKRELAIRAAREESTMQAVCAAAVEEYLARHNAA